LTVNPAEFDTCADSKKLVRSLSTIPFKQNHLLLVEQQAKMSVYFLVGLYAIGTAIYRLLAICCPEQPTSDKRINQSINQPTSQPANQPASQPANQPTNQSINFIDERVKHNH